VRWYVCRCKPRPWLAPHSRVPSVHRYPRLSTLRVQTEYYDYVECLCCIRDERRTGSRRQRSRSRMYSGGLSSDQPPHYYE
jgi:hypothetical protein